MEPTKDNYEPSKAMGAMFDAFELGQKSNSNDMTRLKTELERAQQELQAYRDIIKELLPIAENEIKMSTCIGYSYDKWKSTISKARKLIDTVTPT